MLGGCASSRTAAPEDGRRWRRCAGACIINSKGHVLVGERAGGAWDLPFGEMNDAHESALDAAARLVYEECRLRRGRDVVAVASQTEEESVRYEAGDLASDRERVGQQLQWSIFQCLDPWGDRDAAALVTCPHRRFSRAQWRPLAEVLKTSGPDEQAAYEALQRWLEPILAELHAGAQSVDFAGTWARDWSRSIGLDVALPTRGHSPEATAAFASKPVVQVWRRGPGAGDWTVAAFPNADTSAPPLRKLVYRLGLWEEQYEGVSSVFGKGPGTVHRHTAWLPEPDAEAGPARGMLLAPSQLAHATTSVTRLGREAAVRFLNGRELVLRRSFWPAAGGPAVISEEVFLRL
mmetsp:Transcript_22647/g.70566  ORF Transcript_22647/g.70566 Transcript_22647/m.70566 type:complete len:349 (+) Transcript_22647:103-1149(+)